MGTSRGRGGEPSALAAQTAGYADAMLSRREVSAALRLYDVVVDSGNLRTPHYGNALHAVLSATNRQPVDRERHRRFVRAAFAKAPADPSVHFNAACAYVELGDKKRAIDHLVAALSFGANPEHVRREALLASIRADARVVAALRRPGKPRDRVGLLTHAAPRLR